SNNRSREIFFSIFRIAGERTQASVVCPLVFELIARENACALQGAESVSAGRKSYLSKQDVVRQWIPGGPSLYQTSYHYPFTRATIVLEEKGIKPMNHTLYSAFSWDGGRHWSQETSTTSYSGHSICPERSQV